jgi:hypothetical protein
VLRVYSQSQSQYTLSILSVMLSVYFQSCS